MTSEKSKTDETRDEIATLKERLETLKEEEGLAEDQAQMAERIRYLHAKMPTSATLDMARDDILREVREHREPWILFWCVVGWVGFTIAVGWRFVQVDTADTTFKTDVRDTDTTAAVIAPGTYDANACMVWCGERDLYVMNVHKKGCECIDRKSKYVKMSWSYMKDHQDARMKTIDLKRCAEGTYP